MGKTLEDFLEAVYSGDWQPGPEFVSARVLTRDGRHGTVFYCPEEDYFLPITSYDEGFDYIYGNLKGTIRLLSHGVYYDTWDAFQKDINRKRESK